MKKLELKSKTDTGLNKLTINRKENSLRTLSNATFKSHRSTGKLSGLHAFRKMSVAGQLDLAVIVVVIILSIFGLMMVFDASQAESLDVYGSKYYFIRQQLIWMVLGFCSLGFFSRFDYRHFKKIALPFLCISLLLLLMVFVPGLGVTSGGAHRWLRAGPFTLQPVEIIKLSLVIFLSALFEKEARTKPFLILIGIVMVIIGILQKDLGSAIVISLISFGIYFASGAPIKYMLSLVAAGGAAMLGFIAIAPYRMKRILAFMDPFSDTQGYSYHISQILIALGSGGLLGLGVGQSRQKFAYIPEVTTDSIFSIIGEEFGFIGGFVLICLFCFLLYRGFKIAEQSNDNFAKLLAAGIMIWIGGQSIVNLASMVSLIPLTGVPLPFISYGGSALLTNLTAIGILLSISRYSNNKI